jgi:hypothetical protein
MKLYRHTKKMEQLMAGLLAEMRTNREEIRTNQEKTKVNEGNESR